jgi:hypothetical protein
MIRRPITDEEWAFLGPEIVELESLRSKAAEQERRLLRILVAMGLKGASIDLDRRDLIVPEAAPQEE